MVQTIKFPVIGYTVRVVYTKNLAKTDAILSKRHGIKPMTATNCIGYTMSVPDKPLSYIVLNEDPNSGLVVHEAYHVVCRILRWLSAQNEEEMGAYHLEHLTAAILNYRDKKWPRKDKQK